jgi:hypothetical protein
MNVEGPWLEALTRRLAETPEDFLAEPRVAGHGAVHVAAVVFDLCQLLGATLPASALARFAEGDPRRERNRLGVVLVLVWLLADPWFRDHHPAPPELLALLDEGAEELAAQTRAGAFVNDPERREELARYALARLGLRPAGETLAQAQDRLTTLSAAERARVMNASRAAEQRARAIREAQVRKAAEASADKWTRE